VRRERYTFKLLGVKELWDDSSPLLDFSAVPGTYKKQESVTLNHWYIIIEFVQGLIS